MKNRKGFNGVFDMFNETFDRLAYAGENDAKMVFTSEGKRVFSDPVDEMMFKVGRK